MKDALINLIVSLFTLGPLWFMGYVVSKRIFKILGMAAEAHKNLSIGHHLEFYKLSKFVHASLQEKAKTKELLPEERDYFHHCHAYIDFFEKNFTITQQADNK